MPQSVLLKASGLNTFVNQVGPANPQGALYQADNIVITRDGVIEPVRGFKLYGDQMGVSSSTVAKQLATYKGRIIRHFATTLQYDNGSGTFASFSGSYNETQSGLRVKSVEANGNFYLTLSNGIFKISAESAAALGSATVSLAGGIKALDMKLSLNDDEGFFTQESAVAYRVVWGIKDNNNNLILGVPSQREVITNPLDALLASDFNRLLQELDVVGALAQPDLTATDYYSSLNVSASAPASTIQTNMAGLCDKLDTDLGGAYFATNKTAILAITLSTPPTSAQLTSLQEQYDLIVDQLNSYIGAGGPPTITASASTFTNSTQSSTVDLNITIPEAVTTAHFFQIYRTAVVQSTGSSNLSDIDPGDEMGLVYEANPTSGEITQGYVEVQDITPESFRGANLYTNPNSGEGIGQANELPPKAKDIALFKNYLFYANTETRYRKQFSLLSVTEFVADTSTLTITDGTTTNTYTFSASENVALKKVLISNADTPAQQVEETARSLVHVINRNDDELIYAYYLSGPNDVPGLVLFESREIGGTAFYCNVNNSSISNQFSPSIPTSGDEFIGDNEVAPNRVYYSKVNQPEAVPLLNYFDVGPKDKEILRILALRESLFVFKQEGIYRISGDTAPFVLNLFDSSTILTAPDTADILNNQIYCLSSQGVATVSDTGVSIISRPIENQLIKLNTPNYSAYRTASFGKGYESDRTYYLWTVTRTSDTIATQCFTYNTFTNAWCRRPISKTCAVVNPTDDKMYLGAGDINYIEQERKNFDRTDHANRQYEQTLSSSAVDGNVITLPSLANVSERDAISQVQYLTLTQFNRILAKLDMDMGVNNTNYEALLEASAGDNLRNKLTSLATKLDADPGVNDTNYASAISGFGTTFEDTQDAFNVIVNKLNNDLGVAFTNYPLSENTVSFETTILSLDESNSTVTIANEFPFIQGPIVTYEHIRSEFTWEPQTFGDPSTLKQISESTVLFDKITFSEIDLSFSSDLSPSYESVTFEGSGSGIYGNGIYGENNYGGSGNSIPFRTYIPRGKQRCRYLNCKVTHATAREVYSIYGLSLTANVSSTRAYK